MVKSLEGRAEYELDQLLENLSRADELRSGECANDACDGYSDCVRGIKDGDEEFEEVASLFKIIYSNCKDLEGTFKLFERNLRTSSVAYIDKADMRGNGVSGKGHRKMKVYGEITKLKCSINNIKKAEGLIGAKYKSINIFGNNYQVAGCKSIVYKTIEVLIAHDKTKFDNVIKTVPIELEALIRGAKKTGTGREIVSKMEIDEYIFESKFNATKFLELVTILMMKMDMNPEELEIEYIPAYDA